jgi:hypothetical protein
MSGQKVFLAAEKNAIEFSIYVESEKARRNLRLDENGRESVDYFLTWVSNHAENFRKAWNYSLCKECKKVTKCPFCLKEDCVNFEK